MEERLKIAVPFLLQEVMEMDKKEFIARMKEHDSEFDPDYVISVVDGCLERIRKRAEGSETCCNITMSFMEEAGELAGALSHRVRGRTENDYEILEESADVIIDVLCACRLFDISMEDLKKAIMVKCDREKARQNG